MSWSVMSRKVRDSSLPIAQRVTALHSLLANHHAPLGFEVTRAQLRHRVGAPCHRVAIAPGPNGQLWTESQLLHALELLTESRNDHLRFRRAWDERRRAAKRQGGRQPTKLENAALQAPSWFKTRADPPLVLPGPRRTGTIGPDQSPSSR